MLINVKMPTIVGILTFKSMFCVYVGLKVFHDACIIWYTCKSSLYLYLYYFLVVVYRGPHGRLAFSRKMCYPLKIKTIIIIIDKFHVQLN